MQGDQEQCVGNELTARIPRLEAAMKTGFVSLLIAVSFALVVPLSGTAQFPKPREGKPAGAATESLKREVDMQVPETAPADPATLAALLIVASFAIDRLVSGCLFLLTYFQILRDPAAITESSVQRRAEQRQKFLYYFLAAVLASVVVANYEVARVMRALGFQPYNLPLDFIVTVTVLLGGADRVAALLQSKPAEPPRETATQPIEITGKVTLEEGPSN